MADSPLFIQLAAVGKAVDRGLGKLFPVTLIQLSDEIDPVTRRGAETRIPLQVSAKDSSGVSIQPDKSEPGTALKVTIYDPVLVKPGDGLLFGTRRATIVGVRGTVRDATLRRYVSRCTVQMA